LFCVGKHRHHHRHHREIQKVTVSLSDMTKTKKNHRKGNK